MKILNLRLASAQLRCIQCTNCETIPNPRPIVTCAFPTTPAPPAETTTVEVGTTTIAVETDPTLPGQFAKLFNYVHSKTIFATGPPQLNPVTPENIPAPEERPEPPAFPTLPPPPVTLTPPTTPLMQFDSETVSKLCFSLLRHLKYNFSIRMNCLQMQENAEVPKPRLLFLQSSVASRFGCQVKSDFSEMKTVF